MEAIFEVKKLGTGIKVKVVGEAGISNVDHFKKTLLESLPKKGNTTLFLKELQSIDLSFIQVIAALDLTLRQRKDKLNIFWPENIELKDLIEKAGFNNLIPKDD